MSLWNSRTIAPHQRIPAMLDSLVALEITVPGDALAQAKACTALSVTPVDDRLQRHEHAVEEAAIAAVAKGKLVDFAEMYLTDVPTPAPGLRESHQRATDIAFARLRAAHWPALREIVVATWALAFDDCEAHTDLLPLLEGTPEPLDLPAAEVAAARQAVARLRQVQKLVGLALMIEYPNDVRATGVTGVLGPRQSSAMPPANPSVVTELHQVLSAVAAGARWRPEELLEELAHCGKYDMPIGGWSDRTYLREGATLPLAAH